MPRQRDFTPWTDVRKEQLRQLWPAHTISEIVSIMGGFDHCEDGGQHAVASMATRLMLGAKFRSKRLVGHVNLIVTESARPLVSEPYRPGIDPKPSFAQEKYS